MEEIFHIDKTRNMGNFDFVIRLPTYINSYKIISDLSRYYVTQSSDTEFDLHWMLFCGDLVPDLAMLIFILTICFNDNFTIFFRAISAGLPSCTLLICLLLNVSIANENEIRFAVVPSGSCLEHYPVEFFFPHSCFHTAFPPRSIQPRR